MELLILHIILLHLAKDLVEVKLSVTIDIKVMEPLLDEFGWDRNFRVSVLGIAAYPRITLTVELLISDQVIVPLSLRIVLSLTLSCVPEHAHPAILVDVSCELVLRHHPVFVVVSQAHLAIDGQIDIVTILDIREKMLDARLHLGTCKHPILDTFKFA
jgi:hypothetical protein